MCVSICMLVLYVCARTFVCERFMDVRECLHVSVSCMCVSICMRVFMYVREYLYVSRSGKIFYFASILSALYSCLSSSYVRHHVIHITAHINSRQRSFTTFKLPMLYFST